MRTATRSKKLIYEWQELNTKGFKNAVQRLKPADELPDEVADCTNNDFDLPYKLSNVVNFD